MASTQTNPEIDAQSKVALILTILVVCSILTTTVVVLRLATRFTLLRVGFDDWMIAVALVLAISSAVAIGLEAKYGLGRHVWMLSAEDIVSYLKSFWASILVYNAALTCVKISILLQYRRIFTVPGMRRTTTIGLVIIVCWGIALLSMLAMLCVPITSLWDQSIHGKCLPLLPAYYAPASINIVTDFGVFILPLPAIKSLLLPQKQKIALFIVFGLGFLTCIISIIRLATLKTSATSKDPTWDNTNAAIWSYLELSFAILATCLPTLRPLLVKFMPRFMSNLSRSVPNPDRYKGYHHSMGASTKIPSMPSGTTGAATGSTDALHSDVEYGLQHLPSKNALAEEAYTATVIYGGNSDSKSLGGSIRSLQGTKHGIRATTVVTQESSQEDDSSSQK